MLAKNRYVTSSAWSPTSTFRPLNKSHYLAFISIVFKVFITKMKSKGDKVSMVYDSLGVNWLITGAVRVELWAWENLCKRKKFTNLSLWPFFGFMERKKQQSIWRWGREICKLKDGWFQYFGSLIMGHDINRVDNFRYIIDTLTNL